MSLKVIKAGILDTIQDLGRFGHQYAGINTGGAMDKFAMQIANILVGNKPEAAVIELHFPASVFIFTKPALIALSGADFSVTIDGEPVPLLQGIVVGKNAVLQFHTPIQGTRTYFAVSGSFAIEQWLGSSSTNLKAKAGGLKGRSFRKDDEIIFAEDINIQFSYEENNFKVLPWKADKSWGDNSNEIFVLPGNEWAYLTDESKEKFITSNFIIAQQSDRMGFSLKNIPMKNNTNDEVVSSAVSFGTIQLLPDEGLIVLMADHQTTGGYPRIAHVIAAHHSKLAQMNAGEKINFKFTSQQIAEELLMKQKQHLQQLQNACTMKLKEYLYAN
jgi:antagonist of KipI